MLVRPVLEDLLLLQVITKRLAEMASGAMHMLDLPAYSTRRSKVVRGKLVGHLERFGMRNTKG